ncbi:ABC transporter substrate-binding protein [Prauserella cavernicola]|uniref:ABC transporter substrate-binding protein n=1 Tax=Prauserella cavernicola TaxID=2800127 RepID=A0A934QPK5_9PSEU|nr:ABC transporter substrate-binding protein [Prauserella cavernicola]MBK1783708.1 ABC transporter substrate-binding protein [Prauserella cavernicola]
MPIVVGAHPQNLSLSILVRRRDVVSELRAEGLEFFEYGAGSQTIPLLRVGALSVAGTGATPPILATAQGLDVAVFGMSGPRPERGGLCVRADSEFHSVADLVGKGIGLMPISWHTQFLAAELAAAGVAWRDVLATEIIPATAADAFEQGILDAIVMTDPLYSRVAGRTGVRVLAGPGGHFTNRSVYWATHDVLEHQPGAIRALVDALAASDAGTEADPESAARLLDGLGGSSAADWLPALTSRPWGVSPPDEDFLAEQRRHAAVFADFDLIAAPVDVGRTVDSRFAVVTRN